MLNGKYLAGILAASLAVFVLAFYVEDAPLLRILLAIGMLLWLSLSIFVKNKHVLPKREKLTLGLLSVLFLCASLGYSEFFMSSHVTPVGVLADDAIHTVTASVTDVRYAKPYGASYVVAIDRIDGETFSDSALLELPYDAALCMGDTIHLEAYLDEVSGTYARYHQSKGILLSMTAETVTQTGTRPVNTTRFEKIRTYISENFETHIGGTAAGYATALLTGDKDELDGSIALAYQRLGISHVLAVSGMHFSVIVGSLDILLRMLTLPKKRKNVFLILFAVFFAGICGFSASVLRALIMICLYYLAPLFGERSDPLTSLLLAAVLIVVVNPWSAYDAGLWLSFFSTLGILVVMPSIQKLLRKEKPKAPLLFLGKTLYSAVLCMTAVNLAALFFTMPITYFLFGSISLMSPLANFIFVPLTELVLYLLILLTLTGAIPILAPVIGSVCRFLIENINLLASRLSDLRGIVVSIRYPFAGILLLLLILSVSAVLFFGTFRVRKLLAVFLSSAVLFAGCFGMYTVMGKNQTRMTLTTDGKSDVISLVDDGEVMLADVTTGGSRIPLQAAETLAADYCHEVDIYLLTHLHSYHAGTLKRLAEEIKLHSIHLPIPETDQERMYARAIADAVFDVVPLVYYKRDGAASVSVGDTEVMLPRYVLLSRSVHPVISFSAETNGFPAWIYLGASAMEFESLLEEAEQYRMIILGTNGPKVRHLWETGRFAKAERVLVTSQETAALCEDVSLLDRLRFVTAQYRILFSH